MGDERRESFRLRTVLPVAIRAEQEPSATPPSDMSLDISGGGLGFLTDAGYAVGTLLRVTLVLPDGTTLEAKAEVLHAHALPRKPDMVKIGARFVEMPAETQETLVQNILRLQKAHLRDHYAV